MTPPKIPDGLQLVSTGRVSLQEQTGCEQAVPLSLLDATTAKFGLTSAIWLLECPTASLASAGLADHLRTSLSTTSRTQYCGDEPPIAVNR